MLQVWKIFIIFPLFFLSPANEGERTLKLWRMCQEQLRLEIVIWNAFQLTPPFWAKKGQWGKSWFLSEKKMIPNEFPSGYRVQIL